MKGKLDFESQPWHSISPRAKNLIEKMLKKDPKERCTAQDVLGKPHCLLFESQSA